MSVGSIGTPRNTAPQQAEAAPVSAQASVQVAPPAATFERSSGPVEMPPAQSAQGSLLHPALIIPGVTVDGRAARRESLLKRIVESFPELAKAGGNDALF